MTTRHWYRVEVLAGSDTHCYFGSSKLTEAQVLEALKEGTFIELDDLTYYDEDGEPRPWTEWDPNAYPRIHLNAKYVLTMIPLQEDPRKKSDGTNNVLTYPGTKQEE
jgi:hypothetical protein